MEEIDLLPGQTHIVKTVTKGLLFGSGDFSRLDIVVGAILNGGWRKGEVEADVRRIITGTPLLSDDWDERVELCVATACGLCGGLKEWVQARQDPDLLDAFPAQTFCAIGFADEKIDWAEKWKNCGGGVSIDGRMIALKNDAIWMALSEFNLPFPPFDIGSQWGVIDASRAEAGSLGLISPGQTVEPGEINLDFEEAFNRRVESYPFQIEDDEESIENISDGDDFKSGFSLLSEALLYLKESGKRVDQELGSKLIKKLAMAVDRIPSKYPNYIADAYRATAEIFECWGDIPKAIEYYGYALQKNPKVGVKRHLEELLKKENTSMQ
jgi:tetratricopeptide (TPR) repeat protein